MKKIAEISIYACIAFLTAFFSIHYLSFFRPDSGGIGIAFPLIVSLWLRPVLPEKSFVLFALGTAGMYDALALHTFPLTLIAMSVACMIVYALPFADGRLHRAHTPPLINLFLFALISLFTYSAVAVLLYAFSRTVFLTPALIGSAALSLTMQTLFAFGGSAIVWAVWAR